MGVSEELSNRNAELVAKQFSSGLRMMPSLKTIVIGCVDPRVDPERLLGVRLGEVAVIRNVGGRVTPGVLDELVMLRAVTQAAGGDLGAGWELIVLHHTDCGITRLAGDQSMLAQYFQVGTDDLTELSVSDPFAAVARDMRALADETRLGAGIRVSGLVYDVATGLVDTVTAA